MIDSSPAALLAVWAGAAERSAGARAAELLTLANHAPADADTWTLGRRDALLADVLRELDGNVIDATAQCTNCSEQLEFACRIDALYGTPAARGAEPGPFSLRCDGFEITLRPLRASDLTGLPPLPGAALERVLQRCLIAARCAGIDIDVAALPAVVREAIAVALGDADPLSDIEISLACPACGVTTSYPFDVANYVWEALESSARRMIGEVHRLARAYGWSERDILAIPDRRRRRYLEIVMG